MKKVITQKQTNILSNNFYRGWHNRNNALTPIPNDKISAYYNTIYQAYDIRIRLDGIALVGLTYCLPEEVMQAIKDRCDTMNEGAQLQLNIYLYDAPSGFNFETSFTEMSKDIHPVVYMQHSTGQGDSMFYAPVLHIYNEPRDMDMYSTGTVVVNLSPSSGCYLTVKTCGPIINVNWGW